MAAKVDRNTRIFANSTPENVQRARILASKEVEYGEKGSVQDLLNYVIAALEKRRDLAHELYWQGKQIFDAQAVESN
ncbi:hypothetical protein UFOVP142_42 [uncultured Caudovirales phage]|uniref:Uncharacterized protein n=1 Tax=uncultured Caudovirales phage TaxID=2100421 RepID=A0A6J7XJR2_9CAUD|nr:hypothetical protein UFOVP142_42 [uncultured Caudovirales phage]